ncbi:hypothetical protein C173_03519 [Paenibacillus sp. FSL R7-277]|uniref:hypothetical protein n=1 Tax=Paenibacillus sp. FSL R7-277 TaxID=1227352 RepID=UPI0003E1DD04|nr:hypothetical protein [Paenibacillus sp. FSL R7-277]ETT77553.1 hypothetical protein C173_03519 [Paenibacillus sp. FSL R7-277]
MKLDITRERFELVDLIESTIIIDYPSMSFEHLKLSVWGITLPLSVFGLEAYGLTEYSRPFNDDIYVSGYSNLHFHNVTSANIEAVLYDKKSPHDFIKWPDHSIMAICKTWGDVNEVEDGYKYEIEATLAWPFGRCDLSIVTKSNISIELDSSDFIPIREYVLNTKKYGWNQDLLSF